MSAGSAGRSARAAGLPAAAALALALPVALFSASAACAAPDTAAMEQGVVRVLVRKDRKLGTGTGFVLNDTGLVATNWHVAGGGGRITVLKSGSRNPVAAQLLWSDQATDLALLRADGLGGAPVTLSMAAFAKGDKVFALGFPGIADRLGTAMEATLTEGVVGRTFTGSWGRGQSFDIVQHSAQINPGNSGGPLFDACGAVIGVNTQGSGAGRIVRDRSGRAREVMAGTGVFFASRITALTAVLRERRDAFATSAAACVPSSQSSQLLSTPQIAAVLSVALLIALAFVLRRPRERIVHVVRESRDRLSMMVPGMGPAAGASGAGRGIAISGFAPDGQPVSVKLPGRSFADRGSGLTIGRAPALVDAVLRDERVSRRHLRIRRSDAGFEVEDLNSSNGTVVNGQRLAPFQPVPLDAGDRILIGALELLVSAA